MREVRSMSSHVEYMKKRRAAQSNPAMSFDWGDTRGREGGLTYSHYVRKDVFSGTSPEQIPQPAGKICRYKQNGLAK